MNVITIGDFDGVHRGHQAILQQLNSWAESLQAKPMVLTFEHNTKGCRYITDIAQKKRYLLRYGAADCKVLSFEEWKDVSAEEFVRYLKEELQVVGVACGKDFRFGKERKGNEFTLIAGGIPVKKIENVTSEDVRVSSTMIRRALEQGDLEQAAQWMGHPYELMGTVCHGKGLARQFGLPTVNLALEEQRLLPPYGVYAAYVCLGEERYPAVANVGVRPTVEQDGAPNLEAHILGEVPDLYGAELRVELCSYLRKEQKFETREALFLQIQKDGERSKARLEMLK